MKHQILLLWLCQILFILRVFGQVIVFVFSPSWLPPMLDENNSKDGETVKMAFLNPDQKVSLEMVYYRRQKD